MLGIDGFGVWLAYLLCILSTLLCIVYGIVNWNKPKGSEDIKEIDEEISWEKKDEEITDKQ